MSTLLFSASPLPFASRGITVVSPPVPEVVAAPAPVQLNQTSRVKVVRPSSAPFPKDMYWEVPLNNRDEPPNLELTGVCQTGVATANPLFGAAFPKVAY